MEPRPKGDPGEIAECAGELMQLSRRAADLAGQSSAATSNPGFVGLATMRYAIGGAGVAIELHQRAAELAALAGAAKQAAAELAADQRAWDLRAEAERRERSEAKQAAEDRRSARDWSAVL